MASTAAVPAPDAEREEPPFPPTLLEELLRQLDKTVRARQLYMANNPSYLNALQKLRAAFAPVWEETDSFALQVTEAAFKWSGVVVHEQAEKASDSLPWLFYKDGVREITLNKGFETSELDQLIEIIPKVRRSQADEDDLITILWEHEFECLSYRHVDVSQDGAATPAAAQDPGNYLPPGGATVEEPAKVSQDARAEAEAKPETLTERPAVVKLEDFDSTLYFLDEKEVDYIKSEVAKEYAGDLRRTVLEALLDILELQTDVPVRGEVLQLLDQLTLHMLAGGRFMTVAQLIRESATVLERARDLDPKHRDRLKSLPKRLSDPATLSQILQTLDESSDIPAQEDMNALFGELQGTALETIFDWLGRIQNPKLRALLEVAAARLASANTAELVRLITDGQGMASIEAMRRAGALKAAAAVAPLAKTLGDPAQDMRLAAVSALVEIGSAGAMQTLERALGDADREIRMIAVRALGARAQRSALPKIDALVKGKELRSADLTERMAFFEAYGALCGDGGVPFLDNLLNGKSGMLGRREDPEVRACAAMALGRVKTAKSRESLQKAMSEKDVIVRNAVNRALRGGGAE
jgi:HEAT repeat protein